MTITGPCSMNPIRASHPWREPFIKLALVLACAGFWRSELNVILFPLLGIAWLSDGGLGRLLQTIKNPLAQAILVLCALLLMGLLWNDSVHDGRMKWLKYFVLLMFIPFYSLLNKERAVWAIGGLLAGYVVVLALGIHQWLNSGEPGVALMRMSYLSFSAMLGVGIVTSVSFACRTRSAMLAAALWVVALALIFVQFHQGGRILLLATLVVVLLLAFVRYRIDMKKFAGIAVTLVLAAAAFAYTSPVFQERLIQIRSDVELLQQGDYRSSLGYRLAMWDVGLHGISERPFTGYGTGAPERYFDNTILTYKGGLYHNLPEFQKTSHFHNDWIEIGLHVGIPGMMALLFLMVNWFRVFKSAGLGILGIGLISYILLSGLTDTFLIFSRTPVLLLMITAIALSWQNRPVH